MDDYSEPIEICHFTNFPFEEAVRRINLTEFGVHTTDNHQSSILHYAAETGRFDLCEYALRLGVDPNSVDDTGRTPLHWAANYGYIDIIRCLLDYGAVKNIKDIGGMTPFDRARISRSGKTAEILRTLGEEKSE